MKSSETAAMHIMPPSVSAALGAYTGNDSYFLAAGHMGFFDQGKIRYIAGGGYGDINIDFFGFGDITLPNPVSINTKATAVMQTLKFKLTGSSFYLGPTHRYINAEISPQNINDLLNILPPQWHDPLISVLTQKFYHFRCWVNSGI